MKLTELIKKQLKEEGGDLSNQIELILKNSLSIHVTGGDYGSGYYIVLKFNGNEISSDSLPYSDRR